MNQNGGQRVYSILSESHLSEILSHYDTDFVISVVDNAIAAKYNPNGVMSQANVVAAWEQNFKEIIAACANNDDRNRAIAVRNETYAEIIGRICSEYHLNFTIDDDVDMYSAAFYIYDFFVANFNTNLIAFFKNYICREKNDIYDAMGLASSRKNKDSSTIYGKKTYKDIKLALINANIDSVISYIGAFDINLGNIFSTVYPQREIPIYLSSLVSDTGNFFKDYYVTILNTAIRPVLITDIRLSIQNMAVDREDNGGIVDSSEDDTSDSVD